MKKLTKPTKIILTAGVAVLLLLGGVVAWSSYGWAQYVDDNDRHYDKVVTSARRDLASLKSASDLDSMASTTATAAGQLCHKSILVDLRAQLSEDARQYLERCQQRRDSLRQVTDRAQQLIDRLKSEQQVADILKQTNRELEKVKTGNYAGQKKLWQQANDQLAKIEPDASYTEVMQAQREAIESVVKGYEGIIKADQSEKRANFDNAIIELGNAYDKLEVVVKDSKASYQNLADELYDAVASL